MAVLMTDLQGYVGKSIGEICENHFDSSSQNHCAHFVSHALGLKLGMLCGDMKFETKKTGASIRCDELYNYLSQKGPWDQRLSQGFGCILIFVTSAKNVRSNFMSPAPQKHVGICCGGQVFNFSNSQHRVIVDFSVDSFHNKFKKTYHGNDISLYYGVPRW